MSRNTPREFPNLHIRGNNLGTSGIESDSFLRKWSRASSSAEAPSGRTPQTATGGVGLSSYWKEGVLEEVLDLAGGTSVTSTNQLLPANSIIYPIVCTPVSDMLTPTSYNVGDGTTAARFGSGLTNNLVSEGPAYAAAHWTTSAQTVWQAAAANIKIVPNSAGSGKLLVQVYFRQFVGGQL